jgi:hypothetical protein
LTNFLRLSRTKALQCCNFCKSKMSVLEKSHTFSDYYQDRSYINRIFSWKNTFYSWGKDWQIYIAAGIGFWCAIICKILLKNSLFINFASWSSYDLVDEVRRIRENSYPAEEKYQARAPGYWTWRYWSTTTTCIHRSSSDQLVFWRKKSFGFEFCGLDISRSIVWKINETFVKWNISILFVFCFWTTL